MKRLSESERSEVWDRLEAGESVASVARRLGRARSSVRSHVVAAGFRRPVPAAEWSPLRLLLTEREEISRGVAVGESLRAIARRLGRASSTVSREVASNGGRLNYRAHRGSAFGLGVPNQPSSPATDSSAKRWRRNWRRGGHPSRSQGG